MTRMIAPLLGVLAVLTICPTASSAEVIFSGKGSLSNPLDLANGGQTHLHATITSSFTYDKTTNTVTFALNGSPEVWQTGLNGPLSITATGTGLSGRAYHPQCNSIGLSAQVENPASDQLPNEVFGAFISDAHESDFGSGFGATVATFNGSNLKLVFEVPASDAINGMSGMPCEINVVGAAPPIAWSFTMNVTSKSPSVVRPKTARPKAKKNNLG